MVPVLRIDERADIGIRQRRLGHQDSPVIRTTMFLCIQHPEHGLDHPGVHGALDGEQPGDPTHSYAFAPAAPASGESRSMMDRRSSAVNHTPHAMRVAAPVVAANVVSQRISTGPATDVWATHPAPRAARAVSTRHGHSRRMNERYGCPTERHESWMTKWEHVMTSARISPATAPAVPQAGTNTLARPTPTTLELVTHNANGRCRLEA